MAKFIDLTGQRFERLQVLECAGRTIEGKAKWKCICDCSEIVVVEAANLKRGTGSCGCIRKEVTSKRMILLNYKHGLSDSKTHRAWHAMKQRCLNPNTKNYSDYGGRGITVCDRWLDFENFYEDMGPSKDGLSIDRIDNDKGYFKENCHWATRDEQNRNMRSTKRITYKGQTKCAAEWARELGMNSSAPILYRLKKGMSLEDIMPNE